MPTTTEHAAELRALLKTRYGWTSRQVSIRADYFSLGSALDITIKDPHVPLATVTQAAHEHERIDRCQITGDILGGANRYVHVRYAPATLHTIAARYLDAVTRAYAALQAAQSNVLIPVDGTPFLLGRDANGFRLSVWDSTSWRRDVGNIEGAAEYIGVEMGSVAAEVTR